MGTMGAIAFRRLRAVRKIRRQTSPRHKLSLNTGRLALTMMLFAAVGVSVPQPQVRAVGCFKTAQRLSSNVFAIDQNKGNLARLATGVNMCVNYAQSMGGYYLASASCYDDFARLVNASIDFNSNGAQGSQNGPRVYCSSSGRVKWDPSLGPFGLKCANINATASFVYTPGVAAVERSAGSDGYFTNC
jgi:hypothetical protein